MSIDEKIRLGLAALAVVSSIAVAAHFGHVAFTKPPFLDGLGPGAGSG